MKKSLSMKILIPLVLTTLLPGLIFVFLVGRLAEGLLVDYFSHRAFELARHINEEFYRSYFNKWYEVEGEAFDPLGQKHLGELDALMSLHTHSFKLERINFFDLAGKIIYSTDKRLIGLSGAHLAQVSQALQGKTSFRVVYSYQQDL